MKRTAGLPVLILFSGFFSTAVMAADTLTWKDCVREAASNHPDLISAQEGVSQSKAGEKIAASPLYPQVDSSVSAATAKTAGDTYSYGVSGSQLLFDGFKTASNVRSAVENTKATKQNYRFVSSEVRLRLRNAFIDLLKAQELIHVTEDIAKIRKDNLVLITLRYQSGLEHKGALLTAEANSSEAKFEVEQAKRSLAVAQRQLTKEMGREHFVPLQVQEEFEISSPDKEKPDFETLARNNPSLERLVAQKNAAAFSLKAAKESFFPVLSATAGADRSSSHWPPENDRWNLGLGLSLPLFEGGLRLAQVSQAEAVFNQVRANERSTRDGVVVALEQAWAALEDAFGTVGVQKDFLTATQERATIAEAQYSIGMISYDNWTIIEDDLVGAKKALLDAQANALLAQANWVQAKGETLEYEE